ncbi:MAG: class I SAM-dependent methyltransferase [Rhodospirillaceae bacterium]|nr:class I SAM-dependent methyltransferase [Rhodospirillaceae bacterium]
MAAKKIFIWDTYWDSSLVHCFGVNVQAPVTAALERAWYDVARLMPAGGAILDLGCGNGAVPLAMARAGGGFAITGIDEAAIDPVNNVPDHAELFGAMRFLPRTAMETLPFPDASFDLVTSQFGIEFSGNSPAALAEAMRVLKPGGRLVIMALPHASRAVSDARIALKQARHLLGDSTLFATAIRMVKEYHAATDASAEDVMRQGLDQFCGEVEKTFAPFPDNEVGVLSAMVFCLYQVFTHRRTTTNAEQMMAVETLRTRLAHYGARAQATLKAAMPDTALSPFTATLGTLGAKSMEILPLMAPGHGIVAIRLTARR